VNRNMLAVDQHIDGVSGEGAGAVGYSDRGWKLLRTRPLFEQFPREILCIAHPMIAEYLVA